MLRTSSRLAPSLDHQQVLRPPGEEDARCVQPTSATQSNCVHPHLVCSRLLTPLSQRGRPAESKAPCGFPGDRTFHDVRDRFGGSSRDAFPRAAASRLGVTSVGVLLPTAPGAIEPLTPLSRSIVHPRASLAFARAAFLAVRSFVEGVVRVGGCDRPPRPPSTPPRERRRFVMVRDAFRQQGLFVGSGGHYSPGPATASPPCGDGSTAG